MILISHRGNLNGADCENNPDGVLKALKEYEVEVDLWNINNKLFLGHDSPKYPIEKEFLFNEKLWIHCKNLEAVEFLLNNDIKTNYFFHDKDLMTLTNKGIPWCNYGVYISGGITVEKHPKEIKIDILGVCTDYPHQWKNINKELI